MRWDNVTYVQAAPIVALHCSGCWRPGPTLYVLYDGLWHGALSCGATGCTDQAAQEAAFLTTHDDGSFGVALVASDLLEDAAGMNVML